MSQVKCSFDADVATICLDNPPENRLGPQMLVEFEAALAKVGASGARALLVRTEGDNFSHGADLDPWLGADPAFLRMIIERVMNAFNAFERMPIPTVAAVRGGCFGGGLELALRADVIIAGETALFGHSEQELGIVTFLGGIYRMSERVGRSKAMGWALTSEGISPAVMERRGVVYRVVPDADLVQEATAFAAKLAAGATKAHAAHKALLRIAATGGVASADEAIFDIGFPLFETEDVRSALPAAVELMKAGKPRTAFPFKGR